MCHKLLDPSASGDQLESLGTVALSQSLPAARNGPLTVGVRAEDARLCDHHNAHLIAPVFSCELLGDAVMVTVKLGGQTLTVKTAKDVRLSFGERVGIALPLDKLFWFDAASGVRIRV